MKIATVAFYGFVLGLLGMGLRELLSGCEENRCSMTYMFEYPEYRRVPLPRRVARQYPGYGLYLYGEGLYAQQTRGLKLSGVPVLFLPGNAGSYKQARSLGSVALRKAEDQENRFHLNVFTIDFNEELVALYGGSLRKQTLFLHESIKAILGLYKDQSNPPRSVVLVGHSMGGVVAQALFTLPRFNPQLVSLILTQASPHQAPVLTLDAQLLEFYSTVRRRWRGGAEDLRNVTVLSIGGGHRDYQVRSGLTVLPCPLGDSNKLSLVTTAVPRTWVSTDHLSIVWCKELVLTTVRAFFDLIDPDTRQFTKDPVHRMSVLKHHFVRHPVRMLGDQEETLVPLSGPAEAWTEVNTLRLDYRAPKEPKFKYFLFALSGRRKAYSHFHCRSSSLEMTSWLYGCTQMNGSVCLQAIDLSWGTELLPAYKTITVKLSDLSSVSHLVIDASNLSGKQLQFSVECEWLNLESRTVSIPVPHVLSFGFTVSDVTLGSTGLLHSLQLLHYHQVWQAFRITVVSQCKTVKDRLPSVYRLTVPWFREDSFTTASVPSVTEIAGMLHTSRPDNTSNTLLRLHTAPNCQYKVFVRTSFSKVLAQVLLFCGPALPVYTAAGLLLACQGQLRSLIETGHPMEMGEAVARAVQPHKVELPIYLLHLLLRSSWFQEGWSTLLLPPMDSLPLGALDSGSTGGSEQPSPAEDRVHLLTLLLYVMGAAVAFWGSALFRLSLQPLSLLLALLHRPCVSRDGGTLLPRTQILLILSLGLLGWATCGALALTVVYLLHLYRVLRLQMIERTLKHILNLAPQQQTSKTESGIREGDAQSLSKESNGGPLLSASVLQDVTDDLQLHLNLSALLTLPMMLSAPSLIHWARNLRYTVRLDPDPCWPLVLPVLTSSTLLINCNTILLCRSKLLRLNSCLLLPLCVAMVTFSLMHLYRVTPFLCAALVALALSCHI